MTRENTPHKKRSISIGNNLRLNLSVYDIAFGALMASPGIKGLVDNAQKLSQDFGIAADPAAITYAAIGFAAAVTLITFPIATLGFAAVRGNIVAEKASERKTFKASISQKPAVY